MMRDSTMLPRIIFLWVVMIVPCCSASIWEQIQDPAATRDSTSHSSPVQDNPGVSGGFWGSLLGHRQGQSEGEHNTFRNSQRRPQIETAGAEHSKRQTLPSSLRSLHTLNTEYDEDYEEMFTPEESRTQPHQ